MLAYGHHLMLIPSGLKDNARNEEELVELTKGKVTSRNNSGAILGILLLPKG